MDSYSNQVLSADVYNAAAECVQYILGFESEDFYDQLADEEDFYLNDHVYWHALVFHHDGITNALAHVKEYVKDREVHPSVMERIANGKIVRPR